MFQKNLLFDTANSLVRKIYRKTLNFSYKYQNSLGDQLRRASLSIVLNLVEGGARISTREKNQFLNIAYSSLKETKYLIYFCREFELLDKKFYDEVMIQINLLAKLLYGLLHKKVISSK